jgi:hypothetical protein
MARARTAAALADLKKKLGSDLRTELIFAARTMELNPTSKAAADRLIGLIPNEGDDPGEAAWLDPVDLQECPSGGFSEKELKGLFLLEYRLPKLIAKAVLLDPEKLPQVLSRTQLFITPESDFTIHMQEVCRRQHEAFLQAVDKFSPKDKQWFETIIFNPKTCRAIFLPEQ